MTVTNFVWDELSDNVMFETDENDDPTAVYTHLPGQFGELLSQARNGETHYYNYDGNHSTRSLVDENQNVTDTFVYSAYGEEVSRTGATTNPFGYKGAVGYYTNPETDDIYVRARTYQPESGCWLSKDPLGFVDGPNLFRAYFVPGGIDPLGLWKHVSGTIWEHEGGEDSLYSLASEISGEWNDWVCIWPIKKKGAWDYYPVGIKCDQADVRNLVEPAEKLLKMRAAYDRSSNPPDLFMKALDEFLGSKEKVWFTGMNAGEIVKNSSGQGKSPIGVLFVGGHNFNGGTSTTIGNNPGGPPFSASDLFLVADEKSNSSNTYENARQRIGPPKCWFAREGRAYGFACNSSPGWTNDWANKIMRKSTTVYGALPVVYANYEFGPKRIRQYTQFAGTKNKYYRFPDLLASDHWDPVSGTQ